MKFTKIPETAFKEMQLNAGVLLKSFSPELPTFEKTAIFGATSGGINFTATPTFEDFGADVDNCPKNTKELKKLVSWEISMSGSFVTASKDTVKALVSAADISGDKITPRNDLADADFMDIWWVGDYSDKNGETNGGFVAIHMMNTLSTGGFSIQSADKNKGKFSFTFMAHYSATTEETVPFEVFVKAGTEEA